MTYHVNDYNTLLSYQLLNQNEIALFWDGRAIALLASKGRSPFTTFSRAKGDPLRGLR
ncbi:hypothetical protein K4039_13030 [Lyngbya sp. CCAP 1446/10]|uniref:hypothetical protein n=1 Tax=Lyngbya sp. CCAP 1446/10 TaxID=439293 RepID=UPI0022389822|nr:hypothetical protein [Lyngbya sp. CCAP 1446/10]MCW6050988.1 hypothetical protein [Lyngbya sp. CCAP 1446/10]